MNTNRSVLAVALAFFTSTCGGGPTGPDQPGPPPTYTVTVSPLSGPAESVFTISISGFTKGGGVTGYSQRPDGQQQTLFNLSSFNNPPGVPFNSIGAFGDGHFPGDWKVWAVDEATGTKSNEVTVHLTPAIPAIRWADRIGNSIRIVLLWFTVGGEVDFRHISPSGREDSQVIDFKDRGGCFVPCESIPLANLENGQHTVTAVDRTTGLSATVSFAVPAP